VASSVENNKASLHDLAVEHLWLQFTDMKRVEERGLLVIAEGHGAIVKDVQGREYIDGLAGLFTTQVGHGRTEIADAVAEQLRTLDFYSLFGFANPPSIELAARLAAICPGDLSVVNFVNSGSESVEVAIKIARQYHANRGQAGRYKVISRRGAFHGVTMGALSATGVPARRTPFEPFVPGFIHVAPPDCAHCAYRPSEGGCCGAGIRSMEEAVDFERPETVAAIIVDPIMAAIGVIVPPDDYLPRLRDLCDKYGILLIIDEVLTGFGRTGKMFACEHWGVTPDIMTMSKGLSSGYQPIGGTITSARVAQTFRGNYFQHGQTFSGHPAGCRAAMVSLDIIEREGLVANAARVGDHLLSQLSRLREQPIVRDVRGKGLLIGIELVRDKTTGERFDPELEIGLQVRDSASRRGLLCRADNDCIILAPPLVLTMEQADRIAVILEQAVREVAATV
jgi:adenosylmethionine-8-amino-7-oxononanoate aminotransferase